MLPTVLSIPSPDFNTASLHTYELETQLREAGTCRNGLPQLAMMVDEVPPDNPLRF